MELVLSVKITTGKWLFVLQYLRSLLMEGTVRRLRDFFLLRHDHVTSKFEVFAPQWSSVPLTAIQISFGCHLFYKYLVPFSGHFQSQLTVGVTL